MDFGNIFAWSHPSQLRVFVRFENSSLPIICSLEEEPVKRSIKVPRQRFWLTFTFLLETISGLIIKIPFTYLTTNGRPEPEVDT